MTTIVINEKTKKGRIIVDLIREMGVGEIIESKKGSGANSERYYHESNSGCL